MPRPTAAQLAYGSATVVISTVAMLLLSRTTTGIGVSVIGMAALALGLLVAVTVPLPARAKAARTVRTNRAAAVTGDAPAASDTVTRVPVAHARTGAAPRMGEHSLRR
ncbi:hypothetical protein ACFU5O_04560 [Streptomyces sp. NPDC057445]|uniref:hypothetical protein n=1 Tax=Streptomyces sp. NPDC057445 TaxID=3346136 RepID=UPI0036C604D9